MATFGKTDACLLIVIVTSISYLYLSEDGTVYVEPADVIEEAVVFDAETLDPASLSPRRCTVGNIPVTNELVLDFSYSSVSIPNATKEIGDDILDELFKECACDPTKTAQTCFQWTVVIDQLDYANARYDICTGPAKGRKIEPTPRIAPTQGSARSTVAKIYIQQQTLTSSPTSSAGESKLECFRQTASSAITAALPQLDPSTVETVLATQIESVKSSCKCTNS